MTKVIHVQLMQGRKNYYFGVGLSKGGVVLNKKACIRAGELIRSKMAK